MLCDGTDRAGSDAVGSVVALTTWWSTPPLAGRPGAVALVAVSLAMPVHVWGLGHSLDTTNVNER